MNEQLYEIVWEIHSGLNEFLCREWRVFKTHEEASKYCCQAELDWNNGLSHDEIAMQEGYYYELYHLQAINEIDGYKVHC